MKKFEVGATYTTMFLGEDARPILFKVIGRTACTIKVERDGETSTLRIIKNLSEYRNAETVYPFGKYSMCPLLSAC